MRSASRAVRRQPAPRRSPDPSGELAEGTAPRCRLPLDRRATDRSGAPVANAAAPSSSWAHRAARYSITAIKPHWPAGRARLSIAELCARSTRWRPSVPCSPRSNGKPVSQDESAVASRQAPHPNAGAADSMILQTRASGGGPLKCSGSDRSDRRGPMLGMTCVTGATARCRTTCSLAPAQFRTSSGPGSTGRFRCSRSCMRTPRSTRYRPRDSRSPPT